MYVAKRPSYRVMEQVYVRVPLLAATVMEASAAARMKLARTPLIHEALWIASPSLAGVLSGEYTQSDRKVQQVQRSLLRYLLRMSTRTTPFGLFSGVGVASVASKTHLRIPDITAFRHRTRIDTGWLLAYVSMLERHPRIRPYLIFTYQPILVRVGQRYYFEFTDGAGRQVMTSSLASSGLEALCAHTKRGIRYRTLLRRMLAAIPEANEQEMVDFIAKFIKYGVIRSSLQPSLLATEPALQVLEHLRKIPTAFARQQADMLQRCLKEIKRYDTTPIGQGEDILSDCATQLERDIPEIPGKVTFNVDTTIRFEEKATIQQSLADDAVRLAELLIKLNSSRSRRGSLRSYRQAFVEKYGEHQVVPLLELLNEEKGLGLPKHYRKEGGRRRHDSLETTQYDRILNRIALTALRTHGAAVELTPEDIEQLTSSYAKPDNLPTSLELSVQVAADSEADLQQGKYRYFCSPLVGSHEIGRTIGRFADALGEEATLKNYLTREEALQPEVLHAELIYIPKKGHVANVAIRPASRSYQVAYLATPSPDATMLSLDDIYIGVRRDRFFVWSMRHQKEVRVRQGNMLNYLNAPHPCRFLLEIGMNGVSPLGQFSWGAAASLPMLPRLSYGRFVLALARWKFDPRAVFSPELLRRRQLTESDQRAIHEQLQKWRKIWRVPRYVYLTKSDNRLLLDLQRADHRLELFYAATARNKAKVLTLHEALPDPTQAWIPGSDGGYLGEFVFELMRDFPDIRPSMPRSMPQIVTAQRLYLPGDEWLTCKLYIPLAEHDDWLTGPIAQLIASLKQQQVIDGWFFIRYRDEGGAHLRLRLHASDPARIRLLMPAINHWVKPLHVAGSLRHLSFATYEREIERYGGDGGIEKAEALFREDSELALRLLSGGAQDSTQAYPKVVLAALSCHMILSALGLSDREQQEWAASRGISSKEFVASYRQNRNALLAVLREYQQKGNAVPEIRTIQCTLAAMRQYGKSYRHLEQQQNLTVTLSQLASSFVHMHCNRFLGIDRQAERQVIVYLGRSLADFGQWQRQFR